jgi:hypothetical protein
MNPRFTLSRPRKRFSAQHDVTAVGARGVDAGEHLDEGALAGSVLAAKGQDLARLEAKRNPVQGTHAREVLGDGAELEEGAAPWGYFCGGGLGH